MNNPSNIVSLSQRDLQQVSGGAIFPRIVICYPDPVYPGPTTDPIRPELIPPYYTV